VKRSSNLKNDLKRWTCVTASAEDLMLIWSVVGNKTKSKEEACDFLKPTVLCGDLCFVMKRMRFVCQ